MKIKILLLFILLSAIKLSAQSTFQIGFRDSLHNIGNKIVQKLDGGYCILGMVDGGGDQSYDLIVYNTDKDGNLIWSYIFSTIIYSENGSDIISTTDGGFVISAFKRSSTSIYSTLIFKIDSLGSIVWSKEFRGNQYIAANQLLLSSDDGIIVAGRTNSQLALIMKMDSIGNIIWSTTFTSQIFSQYNSISFDAQGRIIACGYVSNNSYYSLLTSVIDTSGNILSCTSRKSSSNNYFGYSYSHLASNGDMIFCGFSDVQFGITDLLVTRQDVNGNILWQKIYTELGTASSISEDSLHNFLITCSKGDPVRYSYEAYILKIDGNGNALKACYYFNQKSAMRDALIDSDGRIVAIGWAGDPHSETTFIKADLNLNSGCRQQTISVNSSNFVTIDSSGFIQQAITLNPVSTSLSKTTTTNTQSTTYCFSNDISDLVNKNQISIYPNPSSGKFRIEIGNYNLQHLKVYNALGQKIIERDFINDNVDVDMTNYPIGIYYFTIDDFKKGKIVLTNN